MEKSLELNGLVFYLTWNVHKLPSYGQNVVAVVQGDESCRIPTYFHKVRAVFKCYGTRPTLEYNAFLKPSYLNLLTLVQFSKVWTARLPSLLRYLFRRLTSLRLGIVRVPPIYDIPLGYHNQLDLPIKSMEARRYDVFFAGSIVHEAYPIWSLKHWLGTPKRLSREKMISILEAIKEKHPEYTIELVTTPNFQATSSADARDYSEKMMNTRICLVPRGASLETFRFFEGLRYCCVVVVETLPSRWFYEGSPAIRIEDWADLECILERLIKDQRLLHHKHQASLDWWKTKCSEAAVGAYMARKLNSLSDLAE
jgi:hypothetical protein